ncbi:hypothetical protein PILCRDRAFT_811720 [Piloderma croceum F 1598]|uniref:Uncharacterized protein n=1 Tax=Piloderma croceum (strain F 1598) TaxID=765440 RepID=A0A0C3CND2_PILCF|nr:hypothetical protein PILCRDRAFT_811720 [Piloderma croceum F 1598]
MVKTFPDFGRKNGEPRETRRRMSEMLSEWVQLECYTHVSSAQVGEYGPHVQRSLHSVLLLQAQALRDI